MDAAAVDAGGTERAGAPPASVVQDWDPRRYAANAAFVPALGLPVVELLDPRPGERILDLGCGDGVLSAVLVARGAIVVGIDASPEMVEAARARGIDARLGDATSLGFAGEFDAVFSNATLHWVLAPARAIAGVAVALRPGGRFVGEFGGQGNMAAVSVALVAALRRCGIDGEARRPWYFPTPAAYTALLVAGGFEPLAVDLIPRPTPLPGSMADWMETFARPFLAGLAGEERAAVLADAEDLLAPCLRDEEGVWTADYVRLRFAARLAPRR